VEAPATTPVVANDFNPEVTVLTPDDPLPALLQLRCSGSAISAPAVPLPIIFGSVAATEDQSASTPIESPDITPPGPPRLPNGKLLCLECSNHPDGFRGDHELRRHQERKHHAQRKGFVIVDPDYLPFAAFYPHAADAFYSVRDPIRVESRLYNCLPCSQSKRYNSIHNAAAHLRRIHFAIPKAERVKVKRLAKGDKPDGVIKQTREEKKRASQRSNDPPLLDLMNWIRKVEYEVDPAAEKEAEEERERRNLEWRDVMVAREAVPQAMKSKNKVKASSLPSLQVLEPCSPLEPMPLEPMIPLPTDAWEDGPVPDDWELQIGTQLLRYNQSAPD